MEVLYFRIDIDTIVLREAINLRTSLSDFLTKIEYQHMNEQTEENNLAIHFNRALLSSEKDEIADLVNVVNDEYDLCVRKKIKETSTKSKIAFGNEFIAMISANNEYRNKSDYQVAAMIEKYPRIIMCCLLGAISSLYNLVLTMESDENISDEEIQEFKLRIEQYLSEGKQ